MTTVLLIGSGGREHAVARAFLRSSHVSEVIVAPGNGAMRGSSRLSAVDVQVSDLEGLLAVAEARDVDLVFVGPEVPLAQGIVDVFTRAGHRIFGPSQAAARLESSKRWSRAFMERWDLPRAAGVAYEDADAAVMGIREHWGPLVVKVSGLAAGKGVFLPDTVEEATAIAQRLIAEGKVIVVEERLVGPEISLLAFCDGVTARCMPPARDHKRVADGDEGPNTGGMGAICPAPGLPDGVLRDLEREILQRAVTAMAAEGTPYVGVLYAGLMLTEDGAKLLEFNCRFGDPETQVLLALLETPLLDVVEACLDGVLGDLDLRFSSDHAATVVLASEGYPGTSIVGRPILGIEDAESVEGVVVHQAGTRWRDGELVTAGGRILAVTATGTDGEQALTRAYEGVARLHIEGAHHRTDIGR